MQIGKFAAGAARYFRASSKAAKKGCSYVMNETKDLIGNHTQIGRRLRQGVHQAREAVKIKMQPLADKSAGLLENMEAKIAERWQKAAENLHQDKQFMEIFKRYRMQRLSLNGPGQAFRRGKMTVETRNAFIDSFKNNSELDLSSLNNEKFIQEIIETLGIGPTKAAQIFSNRPAVMAELERKFGPKFVQALTNTRSGCFPTRTLEQAQEAINRAFPGQNIRIKQSFGTASIGETYLVARQDGTEAVVKMIKNGVTKENLQMEERLLSRLAKELVDDPKELSQIRNQLRVLYQDWSKELDFTVELANNRLLAQGAQRFKVARITDISADASCIIMDKANGIKMDKLLKILEDFKADPAGFATRYAKEIAANPWLANPQQVIHELPKTLLSSFDEQFLFMKKGGQTIMHGDPHTGNFFITADKKGRLIPEFIDTGSCVTRTGAQITDDVKFFSNYFVGNSRGVAEYFVRQCPHAISHTERLTRAVAKDIQQEIFGKKQNISRFSDVQEHITEILERHGLQLSPENATAMKAQLQLFSAVSEAGKLSNQSVDVMSIVKDIPKAAWGMMKNGTNPFKALKDAIKFAYHHQQQAMGTAYQFTIREADKVVSNGKLAAVA